MKKVLMVALVISSSTTGFAHAQTEFERVVEKSFPVRGLMLHESARWVNAHTHPRRDLGGVTCVAKLMRNHHAVVVEHVSHHGNVVKEIGRLTKTRVKGKDLLAVVGDNC